MNAGKRAFIPLAKRFAVTIGILFGLGVIIQWFWFDDKQGAPMAGLAFILAYLVASIGLAVANGISGAIYGVVFAEGDFKESYLTDLRLRNMPYPRWVDPKRIDYLDQIANDPSADSEDRVKAAYFIGHHRAVVSTAGFWMGIVIENAANEAVLRYSAEAPNQLD